MRGQWGTHAEALAPPLPASQLWHQPATPGLHRHCRAGAVGEEPLKHGSRLRHPLPLPSLRVRPVAAFHKCRSPVLPLLRAHAQWMTTQRLPGSPPPPPPRPACLQQQFECIPLSLPPLPPPPAGAVDDDAESAGAPGASAHGEEPHRELVDAGMVLRDPSTFHLLIHHVRGGGGRGGHRACAKEALSSDDVRCCPCLLVPPLPSACPSPPCQVIRRLEAATEAEALPKDDQELVLTTRLLQLAVGCRAMMRERRYRFAGRWRGAGARWHMLGGAGSDALLPAVLLPCSLTSFPAAASGRPGGAADVESCCRPFTPPAWICHTGCTLRQALVQLPTAGVPTYCRGANLAAFALPLSPSLLRAEASPELLTTFYPTLSAIMLDAMLRQAESEEAAAEGGEAEAAEPGAAVGSIRRRGAAGGQRGAVINQPSVLSPRGARRGLKGLGEGRSRQQGAPTVAALAPHLLVPGWSAQAACLLCTLGWLTQRLPPSLSPRAVPQPCFPRVPPPPPPRPSVAAPSDFEDANVEQLSQLLPKDELTRKITQVVVVLYVFVLVVVTEF